MYLLQFSLQTKSAAERITTKCKIVEWSVFDLFWRICNKKSLSIKMQYASKLSSLAKATVENCYKTAKKFQYFDASWDSKKFWKDRAISIDLVNSICTLPCWYVSFNVILHKLVFQQLCRKVFDEPALKSISDNLLSQNC